MGKDWDLQLKKVESAAAGIYPFLLAWIRAQEVFESDMVTGNFPPNISIVFNLKKIDGRRKQELRGVAGMKTPLIGTDKLKDEELSLLTDFITKVCEQYPWLDCKKFIDKGVVTYRLYPKENA